ncbi:ABC transporter ATP-binding protein [Planctellipticum variicoloris]|uniref:ABC transporter ATP-binding protein n=1 Tax=Planctellipticum variicoloris TaxID=3064265 RepID=UPI00301366B2|nr:ABC transporter ATP-binding protein [Planctomycetaceae bacterium SH412]
MSQPFAIEASEINKVYGTGRTQVVALRQATLRVPKGKVAAILGPSGSGKSTLLTIVGLVTMPTSGQVTINGQLIVDGNRAWTDLRAYRRRHIGFVFQKANLIPFLTAIENVQVALELNGVPSRRARSRAAELLQYLGVLERSQDIPARLSGGEQQRVAVARALANDPDVLLADEPTAALDSQRAQQVMELFAKIAHEQNAGVVVVTHDHRFLNVFDTIYAMEDGVLQEQNASSMLATT